MISEPEYGGIWIATAMWLVGTGLAFYSWGLGGLAIGLLVGSLGICMMSIAR
jgi:hypothetical protein